MEWTENCTMWPATEGYMIKMIRPKLQRQNYFILFLYFSIGAVQPLWIGETADGQAAFMSPVWSEPGLSVRLPTWTRFQQQSCLCQLHRLCLAQKCALWKELISQLKTYRRTDAQTDWCTHRLMHTDWKTIAHIHSQTLMCIFPVQNIVPHTQANVWEMNSATSLSV